MSRSFKHFPISKQRNCGFMKRRSCKLIRKHAKSDPEGLASGAAFRRVISPWDICDWKFFTPYNEFRKDALKYDDDVIKASPDKQEKLIRFKFNKWYRAK